jgi:zinc D-Ala-D-Ala carboxypeptidase
MGDLTKNFSLDEFLVSSTAAAGGIANTPTKEHLRRIRTITAPGIQLVRDLVARAMVLTSGYRNPEVNALVGGVPTSDHAEAYAVDCRAAGLSAFGLARLIAEHMQPGGKLYGKIDQLILETSRSVVHISFAPRRRGQIMTQRGGPGTPFVKGIQA